MRRTDRLQPGRWADGWRRGGLLTVLIALLVGFTGVGAASAATLVNDNFEDGNAAGWTTTGGVWIVANENTKVLRQSSLAAGALARIGALSWRDYTVTAQVEPTSFNGLPGFTGVVARASSTTNYYALVLRPDNTAALLRVIGGQAAVLATQRVTVRTGVVYTLALRVAGRALTGSVNGGVRITATDGFLLQGPAGLTTTWTTASFDNVRVDTP